MLQVQFFILFLLATSSCYLYVQGEQAAKTSEFVLAPTATAKKNMSLNTLKEHIGKKTKQAFECTTSIGKHLGQAQCRLSRLQQDVVDVFTGTTAGCLKELLSASAGYNRVLGTIQHRVALLQQKFSSIIEKLIDNQAPFKKVSKKTLENSLAVLTTVHQQLNTCAVTLQRVNNDFKKSGVGLPGQPLAKRDTRQVIASVQAATKELQAQVTILQQAFTSINTDQCLKNI